MYTAQGDVGAPKKKKPEEEPITNPRTTIGSGNLTGPGTPIIEPPVTYSPQSTGNNTTSYPTYNSPTAGATYNYNQAAPTWSWTQQAPTWNWDDSGRPGEWQWDDSGRPGDFSYADAPTYASQYQAQINQMVNDILNRPAFTYDYNQDPLYQQYAEAYTRNGQQAMNDTLAQMAARTGGLASSYAGTASQQTYNKYMDALNDKIPELYQLAYGMYRDQGTDMRNNLSMVQGLENTDYGRYMDQLGQYNTDRNLAYNQWLQAIDQYNTDRNFSYGQYQDLWDRYYNDRNFSYGQYQDQLGQYNTDRNFSYDQYIDAWNQWNKNRDFDYDLWADNLSRQEAAAKARYNSLVDAYNAALTEQAGLGGRQADDDDKGKGGKEGTYSYTPYNGPVRGTRTEVTPDRNYGGFNYNGRHYDTLDELSNAISNMGLSDGELEQVRRSLIKNGIMVATTK